MPDYFLNFIVYSVLLIAVMLVAELTYRLFKLNTEWTRKIAHVGSGIVALTYPIYLNNHWVVFALTLSFTGILYTSKKLGLFKSIFSVGRKSYGELFFVWSTWLLFLLYQYTGEVIYYYLPFSVVVFADPAAALIGKNFAKKKYTVMGNQKSYLGSFAFFLVSFVLSYYFLKELPLHLNLVLLSIGHAAILTLVEAISSKGFDNVSIPFFSVLILFFFI